MADMTNDEAARVLQAMLDFIMDDEDVPETEREALRLAIAALQPWRPIAEAPRDGTRVLGFWRGAILNGNEYPVDYAVTAWCQDIEWHEPETKDEYGEPTAWMPLPPPPEAKP